MRRAGVLALLLVTACGASPEVASPSPTPLAAASASPPPSASPNSAPVLFWLLPSPAPKAPTGQCYLPVSFSTMGSTQVSVSFYEYPSGVIPAANTMTIKAPSSTFTFRGPTYDRAVGRWIPAPAEAISPDGFFVAYAEYDLPPSPAFGMGSEPRSHLTGPLAMTGRVHVIDTRTGADRILYSGAPTYSIAGFTSDGIYLAQVTLTMDGAFASGLFLLNAAGGSPQPVRGGNYPLDRQGWSVRNAAAWGTDYSGTGGGPAGGNRLVRLDLKTGTVQAWMTGPADVAVSLGGLDANQNPLVVMYQAYYPSAGQPAPSMQGYEVRAMSAPEVGKLVLKNTDPSATIPNGPGFTDSTGTWLSGAVTTSVWLYTAQSGLHAVPVPLPAGQNQVGVAGTCA